MRFQVAVPVRDAAMVHHSPVVACCVLRAALLAVCFGCYPCALPRFGVASVCAVLRLWIVCGVVLVVVHEGGALSAGDCLRVGCCAEGAGVGIMAPGRCDASGGLIDPCAHRVGAGERDVWGPGMHRSMRLPPWRALYTLSYRPCALFPATT